MGIYKVKEKGASEAWAVQIINFMGRQIPVIEENIKFLATARDKAIDPYSAQRYLR